MNRWPLQADRAAPASRLRLRFTLHAPEPR